MITKPLLTMIFVLDAVSTLTINIKEFLELFS